MKTAALSGGLADPVFDAQSAFRSVLDAMSQPGRIEHVSVLTDPPAPLTPAAGALLCALADDGTPVFLDADAEDGAAAAWIAFHTGALAATSPSAAAFAVITDPVRMPPLAAFRQGSDEYPDRSSTLILLVDRLDDAGGFELAGPGIAASARLQISPLPSGFAHHMDMNRAQFPRGVDLIFVAGNRIAALPRSVRIRSTGAF